MEVLIIEPYVSFKIDDFLWISDDEHDILSDYWDGFQDGLSNINKETAIKFIYKKRKESGIYIRRKV